MKRWIEEDFKEWRRVLAEEEAADMDEHIANAAKSHRAGSLATIAHAKALNAEAEPTASEERASRSDAEKANYGSVSHRILEFMRKRWDNNVAAIHRKRS